MNIYEVILFSFDFCVDGRLFAQPWTKSTIKIDGRILLKEETGKCFV